MIYVPIATVADVVATQAAGDLLYFAENERSGDYGRDTQLVVRRLWEFNALVLRLGNIPKFQVPQPRRGIRDEVRDRIFARDGNRCLKCGSEDALEIDHVVPIAVGGLDVETNFQTLCAPCNRVKHTDAVDYRIPVLDFSASLNGNPA